MSTIDKLLTITALSGECCIDIFKYMDVGSSYKEKLLTKLKNEGMIKLHNKDGLKGYRLTIKGKKQLLGKYPERFSFYLNGCSDTNRPRSDYTRRLRLQQASIVYILLLNAGIPFFRDEKPLIFEDSPEANHPDLPLPVFYHSREFKMLGNETVKVYNSRTLGILLVKDCVYAVFYTGDSVLKWENKTELKLKSLFSYHMSRGVLSKGHITPCYHPDTPVKAFFIGSNMDTALRLMTVRNDGQDNFFRMNNSFDYFHFVPASPFGEILLKLLCFPELADSLRTLLLSDLQPGNKNYGFDHDATTDAGLPVLLTFDFDMLRITRFHTALSFRELTGHIICFDFQRDVLAEYFGDRAVIETIDTLKFERRFLHGTQKQS